MEKLQSDFRYERKYILNRVEHSNFLKLLYKNSFKEIYYPRIINNLYFDTIFFDSFYENVEGLSDRTKYRVRWYGNSLQESFKTFEIKIKSEFLNKKKSYDLGEFVLNPNEEKDLKILSEKINQILSKNKNQLKPFLLNKYNREYFFNERIGVRITIDTDLKSYSIISKQEIQKVKDVIVEIKYNKKNEFLMKNLFELELSKNSKYVNGVNSAIFYNID